MLYLLWSDYSSHNPWDSTCQAHRTSQETEAQRGSVTYPTSGEWEWQSQGPGLAMWLQHPRLWPSWCAVSAQKQAFVSPLPGSSKMLSHLWLSLVVGEQETVCLCVRGLSGKSPAAVKVTRAVCAHILHFNSENVPSHDLSHVLIMSFFPSCWWFGHRSVKSLFLNFWLCSWNTGMGQSIPTPFFFFSTGIFPNGVWVPTRGKDLRQSGRRAPSATAACVHELWAVPRCRTAWKCSRMRLPRTSVSKERRAVWSRAGSVS